MFGSNTEKAIQLLDSIITTTTDFNVSQIGYRLSHTLISDKVVGSTASGGSGDDSHQHGAGSLRLENKKSNEDPYPGVVQDPSNLKPMKAKFDSFISKIELIDKNIYVRKDQMHDSIGSPYTELYRLQKSMNDVISYSRKCSYLGEYVEACLEVLHRLDRVTMHAIDAKWAVIQFADYLERGYNHIQGQNPDTTR